MKKSILFAFVFLLLVGVVSAEVNSCAKEGEQFSKVFTSDYSENCCSGLKEWHSGMDTRIVKDGKCVETGLESGYPVGTCLNCGNGICESIENLCNCPEDCSISLGCNNLYWIDNENKSCGQQEFCGAYMYYGLQTFETKGECEKAGEKTYCTSKPDICTLEYMPVCGSDGDTYGNGCNACGSGVEYWVSGECKEKQFFNLSNGRKVEIKIMPETLSEIASERLGLNFTIVLKEVGKGNETKVVYEATYEEEGRILGLFKVRANVSAQIDAENGEIVKTHKPWWAFLVSGI